MTCNDRAKSSAVAGRSPGSLAMPAFSSSSRDAGTSGRPVSGTGRSRIRRINAYGELSRPGCSNGDRPTSRCHRVAASEYTSDRGDAGVVAYSTSGGDHGTETPASGSSAWLTSAAIPKSVSAGVPYWLVSTLAGLMSRCSRPERCAVSTALASWMPIRSASATPRRSYRTRSARLARG